jgi:hypothetical protein
VIISIKKASKAKNAKPSTGLYLAKGSSGICPALGCEVLSKKKIEREGFRRKPDTCFLDQRGESSQGLVHSAATAEEWIGAQRRPLTAEGRQPLSFPPDTLQIEPRVWRRGMQQLRLGEVMIYADITEVRMETRVAECKKLLAEGWVLLGVYPLTTAGEPAQRKSRKGQQEQNPQDSPRYVQRMVGYIMGKKRES